MRHTILCGNLFFGIAILALSAVLLAAGSAFIQIWFYSFAWWSTILILDSLNYRIGGSSVLSRLPKNFLGLAFLSVPVWLVFELYNLVLKNWSYHQLPQEREIRWLGYFIAFATVIPALLELADLWKNLLAKRLKPGPRLKLTGIRLTFLTAAGGISLLLPLLVPHAAFPLVWLGFIFFLDPINFRKGRDSLFGDLSRGNWLRLWSWVLAGLTAGFLWEFFNFWAGSHWQYSLPFFEFGKIFQMPVLGYFGFAPFALEIFVFLALYRHVRDRLRNRTWAAPIIFLILLIFDGLVFYLIDTFTWVKG
ncbi:MAG: hypothetical protein R6V02_09440 [Candidatus Aminicenantes bacterium]